MSKRSRRIAQPVNSERVLLPQAKVVQPSQRCDSCTAVPACLANNTCLNTKNVKIHSVLLQRQLQTSWSFGRQMGMCLHICMMPVFKNVLPGPYCASYRTKGSPNRQTARQEATDTPVPWGKASTLHISLLGGLPGSPWAPRLLRPRSDMRVGWKEKKWGNFAGVCRELL